jgi:integrase
MRATFVTVSLAQGQTETWVADRTGHRSSQMLQTYRRIARTYQELSLGPLAPLHECIPELAQLVEE